MNLSLEPGIVLTIIAVIAGITIYSFLKSRHLERMLRIEKGIYITSKHKDFLEIKFGFLSLGIGIGILTAYIIRVINSNIDNILYPALIFCFGGIGLIFSFFFIKKYQENN
ncbi:DUF6249 domain-containing protein [Polaribacter porphyrae]|nr:DUF6249 domain-containing protein [Polaribacter porphyrae]